MDSRIQEIENELFLHAACPIHSLLKSVPAFNDVIELYYRCKLCDQEPVHVKIESFLHHFQEYHPAYYTDSMHISQVNECKTNEDVVTVIISSQKLAENETQEEYVEHNTPSLQIQCQEQTDPPIVKPHDTTIAYSEPPLKKLKTGFSAENECVIDNSQVSYIADASTYQEGNQISNQSQFIVSAAVSEPHKIVNYPYESDLVTEYVETTPQNIELSTDERKEHLVTIRSPVSQAQGAVLNEHFTQSDNVESTQVHKNNCETGITDATYSERNKINRISYEVRRLPNNSTNEQMLKTEQDSIEQSSNNCGQSIIEQAMSMSHDTESFNETDLPIQSSNEAHQQVKGAVIAGASQSTSVSSGPSQIIHMPQDSVKMISDSISTQIQQGISSNTTQMVSIQIKNAGENDGLGTKSQNLQVTYAVANNSEPSPTKVLKIPNKQQQIGTTFESSTLSSHPRACNVTLEELPRRGRPPNWINHSVAKESTSHVDTPDTIMHKGPLHHNQEDRIKETLVHCQNTDQSRCDYVVLGTHFHCRACSGALREDDLVSHRYYHSSTRLISDINVKELVEHGEFCENVSCNTGSVIHMHCNYCVVVIDTGYKFHEHLKTHHAGVWEKCQVFSESDTDTEQCLLCRAYFGTRESLTKHVTDRHFAKFCVKEMQFSVVTCCSEEFLQVEPYRIHMAVEHKTLDPVLFKPINLPLRCIDCGEEVTGKTQMKKHRWQMHSLCDNTLRTCTKCGASFANLKHLEEHWKTMHPNAAVEKSLPCTDCVKAFTSEAVLKRHFSSVHAKKYKYHCLECAKGYYAEFQYLKHLEDQHDYEKTLLQCNGCTKKFLEENSLERHRKICLKYIHKHKLEGSL